MWFLYLNLAAMSAGYVAENGPGFLSVNILVASLLFFYRECCEVGK